MILFIILGILLGALSVMFALQNIAVITVNFLSWHITGSLSIVLFVAIIAGVLISLLISVPEVIKSHFQFRSLKKQNQTMHDEMEKLKTKLADAEKRAAIATSSTQAPTQV